MTIDMASLVSDNLDIWTTAVEHKSGAGRGGKRISLYGINRLRALILDLAVRGQLVSQEPSEEAATVALTKLAKACRCKIELGQARKPKALLPLPANLSNLPEGWAWTQLGKVAEISPSNSADDQVDASFVPMALVSTRIDGAHKAETRKWSEIKKGFTHFAEGDIGLAKITPCFENGKAAIFKNLANGIGAGTTELHVARPWSDDVDRRYLLLTMKTASYLHQGEAGMTGTAGQKRVTRSYFESSPLPLPPLAEQQRIVAKVDELMVLCDALETESAAAMAAHQTLVEALLSTVATSTDAADLASNWARLETHFDILFTSDASVDALKKTILDLAVRGKLVPQHAVDEPASELLRKIAAERARLKHIGAIGKRKVAESNSDGTPYAIPDSWVWTRIADIGHDWGQKEPSGDFNYVDIGSIDQRAGIIRSPSVLSASEAPSRARKIVKIGTVIYSTVRPYLLNIAIVDQNFDPEPIASTAFAIIHPFEGISAGFLYRYLRSATFIAYVEGCQTGIAYPAINDKQFFSAWFPLPPFAEQQRIVAKVDELMALCDMLKACLSDSAQTQRQLADAITPQDTI